MGRSEPHPASSWMSSSQVRLPGEGETPQTAFHQAAILTANDVSVAVSPHQALHGDAGVWLLSDGDYSDVAQAAWLTARYGSNADKKADLCS